MNPATAGLAASITKAASAQTYYTIRFLADRGRRDDAYRSYAYFRWVDDVLDSDLATESYPWEGGTGECYAFLQRQKSLLEGCCRGEFPRDAVPQETLLIELIRNDREKNSGLRSYLRNMMWVMEFDVRRRGVLISQVELEEYTRRLAVAVTENIHHFIGHDAFFPLEEARYLAVSAAHITHMLRDAFEDARAGYFNIPREVLQAGRIGPQDITASAYRDWAKGRAGQARRFFREGKAYFQKVNNLRLRLAGFGYIARFEWLLETLEREGYLLRPHYGERKRIGAALRMSWMALSSLMEPREAGMVSRQAVSQRQGKA
jgi:phytoene/squalene synthetase